MSEIQEILKREGITLADVVRQCGIDIKANGDKFIGLCPFHDERNPSFFVFEDDFFKCFGCGESGDVITFLQKFHSCSFKEALAKLGIDYNGHVDNKYQTPKTPQSSKPARSAYQPQKIEPPVEKWQEKAALFVNWAHEKLLKNKHRLSWLKKRGITKDTVRSFRLGWNPGKNGEDRLFRPRESWGLETIMKENGRKKVLWFPIGLVIPQFDNNKISRIRIRRPKKYLKKFKSKYYVLPGSSMGCMLTRPGSRAFIVIESELDAMLCDQEAGAFCGAVALGSSSTRPDADVYNELKQAAVILLALDYDSAGAKEIDWWQEQFPQTERWPVPQAKDPGDAFKKKVDIAVWIRSGLPPGWHCGPSFKKQEKKGAAVKQEVTKIDASTPLAVQELADILNNHPVSIHVTAQRTHIRHTQKWARQNWDTVKRLSELVFMTDEVMDFLEDHPEELITRGNILI